MEIGREKRIKCDEWLHEKKLLMTLLHKEEISIIFDTQIMGS
jgi:hypothetical protein